MLEINKIYHGDCIEVMNDIQNESIDMVLADPPYGTTACKWDSIIPLDKMWIQLKELSNQVVLLFLWHKLHLIRF